jgi:hypothetical protein
MSDDPYDPELAIDGDDGEWELDPAEGETLEPDAPDVISARIAAGDPTAPTEPTS